MEFSRFDLPEGAEFYAYHEEREQILGAYTRANRHDDGGFVFEPYGGEALVLELDLPAGAGTPTLELASVIHDYRDVLGLMDGRVRLEAPGQNLGACLVDVNCPQGDPYPTQKRATMRTLSGGALCSGALLNNTGDTNLPYVLTADHCGQTASTVFLFRYQTSGCASGSAPTSYSSSGCTLLTTSSTYDCRLLRMNALPPATHEPYLAGWTRSTGNASMAFAMGHPSGGPKKISIDNNGTASETTLWRVQWNTGTLEGGSSGGPLFDQNGRVKGPACCVDAFVCTGQTAWFGRFDRFWTSNVQINMHMNGDAAVEQALRTIEAAIAKYGMRDHRPVFIHGTYMRPEQIERMKKVGAIPTFLSAGIVTAGDGVVRMWGAERAGKSAAANTLEKQGYPWTLSHDAPVTPSPSVLALVDAAVNRRTASGNIIGPDERVTPYAALGAVTRSAAFQIKEEKTKGTLEAGKLADLVILDRNPLKVDPATIKTITVMQTLKEGVTVYEAKP